MRRLFFAGRFKTPQCRSYAAAALFDFPVNAFSHGSRVRSRAQRGVQRKRNTNQRKAADPTGKDC
jgi:hypothetical protein